MKKQKLLLIPFVLGIGLGFYSCNLGNKGGNITRYPPTPAVVDYRMDMGGTVLGTPFGYIAAPSLLSANPGDCLYLSEFSVDYDNQPSTQFYTATGIVIQQSINQSVLEQNPSIVLGNNDTLKISGLQADTNPFYNGKLFILATSKDTAPGFRLVYNTQEVDSAGIKNLYLLARPSSSTPGSTDVQSLYAFDLNNLIYAQQNNDTTINAANFKYIKVILNYISGITDGVPQYTPFYATTAKDPFLVCIFKQ